MNNFDSNQNTDLKVPTPIALNSAAESVGQPPVANGYSREYSTSHAEVWIAKERAQKSPSALTQVISSLPFTPLLCGDTRISAPPTGVSATTNRSAGGASQSKCIRHEKIDFCSPPGKCGPALFLLP
jgi:hypothetical protein